MQGARSYDSPFSNWDANRSRKSFARADAVGADERYGDGDGEACEGAGGAGTSAKATLRPIPAAHPAHAHGSLPPLPGTNKVSSFEMPGLFEADHNDVPKGCGGGGEGEGIDRQTDDGDRAADHHGQKHDRRHHHHHQ